MKRKMGGFLIMGILALLLAGCSLSSNRNERAQKEMLKNRYGFNEVSTLEFKDAHTVRIGVGVWFDHNEIEVPAFGRYQCDDRVVTVRADKDDYFYDELARGVNNYYRQLLDTDNVFVIPCANYENKSFSSAAYADFFKNEAIDSVDDETIQRFLNSYGTEVTIIMQKNIYESDEAAVQRIKEIIDTKCGEVVIEVELMRDLSGIVEHREHSDRELFDNFIVDNVDLNKRIKEIKSGSSSLSR